MKVEDIMTGTIISVTPEETVGAAIREMAKYRISCIIVTAGGRAEGILTERDVLRGVATHYDDFLRAKVAKEMSKPVITAQVDMSALAASKLMGSRQIKRLLIVDGQQPVGVVTQTDITTALISMAPFKNIADLMTSDVVTVNETATMTEAAQLMAARNISCVVILRHGKAAGIVTERDILQCVARFRGDPTRASVADIMSFPVTTVSPTHSVMSASRLMDQMRIHRLIVGSTTDVKGIVTQTDIIAAVQGKLEEVREAQLQHKAVMTRLVDSATTDLSSIQEICRRVLAHQQASDGLAPHDPLLEELENHVDRIRDSLETLTRMV